VIWPWPACRRRWKCRPGTRADHPGRPRHRQGPLTFQILDPPAAAAGGLGACPDLCGAGGLRRQDLFTVRSATRSRKPPGGRDGRVEPDPADRTPPTASWTAPKNNAVVDPVSATPVFTDSIGPIYSPYVFVASARPSMLARSRRLRCAPQGRAAWPFRSRCLRRLDRRGRGAAAPAAPAGHHLHHARHAGDQDLAGTRWQRTSYGRSPQPGSKTYLPVLRKP